MRGWFSFSLESQFYFESRKWLVTFWYHVLSFRSFPKIIDNLWNIVTSIPSGGKFYKGVAVSPETPRTEMGTYWGYKVRLADSFTAAFTESSYPGGYDLTIGTSDTGDSLDTVRIRHFKLV